MNSNSIVQIWGDFCNVYPEHAHKVYDAWAFGDSKETADELAALVLEGRKTATSSLYILFEGNDEVFPYPGLYNIILDGAGEAVGIIETQSIDVVPFDAVTAEFAYLEGEGDRSLGHWQRVHETFFRRELEEINKDFNYKVQVVCESFKLVYSK